MKVGVVGAGMVGSTGCLTSSGTFGRAARFVRLRGTACRRCRCARSIGSSRPSFTSTTWTPRSASTGRSSGWSWTAGRMACSCSSSAAPACCCCSSHGRRAPAATCRRMARTAGPCLLRGCRGRPGTLEGAPAGGRGRDRAGGGLAARRSLVLLPRPRRQQPGAGHPENLGPARVGRVSGLPAPVLVSSRPRAKSPVVAQPRSER